MYVDGFLLAVPTANKDAYREYAKMFIPIFKEYGALSTVECWGNDVPDGKINSFRSAVHLKDDETVVFSWITWPSKEVRDAGIKQVFEDPRLNPEQPPMPFDGQRMMFGGFELLVEG